LSDKLSEPVGGFPVLFNPKSATSSDSLSDNF